MLINLMFENNPNKCKDYLNEHLNSNGINITDDEYNWLIDRISIPCGHTLDHTENLCFPQDLEEYFEIMLSNCDSQI